jgi:hypothetical protein
MGGLDGGTVACGRRAAGCAHLGSGARRSKARRSKAEARRDKAAALLIGCAAEHVTTCQRGVWDVLRGCLRCRVCLREVHVVEDARVRLGADVCCGAGEVEVWRCMLRIQRTCGCAYRG